MKKKNIYIFLTLFFCFFLPLTKSYSNALNNIFVVGNDRISNETILMFSKIENNTNINDEIINNILKNLYETNFFEDVFIEYENNQLIINVKELPIINNINYNGIKAKKIRDVVFKDLKLRSRSSFNKLNLKKDKEKIIFELRNLGYYFSKVDILTEDLEDNKIDLTFNITLGDKSKIKKITFLGDKIFKSGKLKSLIIRQQYNLLLQQYLL